MKKLFVLLSLVLLVSCKTYVPIIEYRDSVRVEYKYDSIYIYEKDSIYIDRWRENDTVYINKVTERIKYQDKIVEQRDTIYLDKVKETTVVEKYVPSIYKWALGICIFLLVLIIAYVIWKILKK